MFRGNILHCWKLQEHVKKSLTSSRSPLWRAQLLLQPSKRQTLLLTRVKESQRLLGSMEAQMVSRNPGKCRSLYPEERLISLTFPVMHASFKIFSNLRNGRAWNTFWEKVEVLGWIKATEFSGNFASLGTTGTARNCPLLTLQRFKESRDTRDQRRSKCIQASVEWTVPNSLPSLTSAFVKFLKLQ